MELHWRPAKSSDLPDIMRIAGEIHPDLAERLEVYAEKLRLFPDGCLALVAGEAIVGYGFAHPWKLREIPPLDAFLAQLPDDADCLYVHDVAVLPAFRGRSAVNQLVGRIAALARSARIGALALVSVYDTESLWGHFGFRFVTPDARLRTKLRSYGDSAKYMICDLDGV
jgi:ribosomal protein S18 acetylase RimI-like enzyme